MEPSNNSNPFTIDLDIPDTLEYCVKERDQSRAKAKYYYYSYRKAIALLICGLIAFILSIILSFYLISLIFLPLIYFALNKRRKSVVQHNFNTGWYILNQDVVMRCYNRDNVIGENFEFMGRYCDRSTLPYFFNIKIFNKYI